MKRYKEYQTISLPWLNNIPANWTMHRNKVFLHESKDVVGNKSKDYTLLSLTLNGIIPRDVSSGKGKFPSDFGTYKIIRPNDIVFCLFDIDETPRTVGLSNLNGMLTGAYDVFHISGINSRYLLYYYLCLDNVKALRPLYKGLRKTINIDTFLGTRMPVPPSAEQDQIVRYLDWQVSKINRLIAAKRKEIALLKEHRAAKINQAVTTGIHSDTQLAYTGYNWLPYAPANWKPVPAKALFRNVTELRRQDDSMLAVTQKYGLIEQTEYMRLEGRRIVLANDNLDKWLHTEPNDFIISLRSFQGGLEMCSKPGCVTWHYVVLRAQRDVYPDFYKWFFKSAAYVGALQKTSDFIRDGQDLRFSNFVKVGLFIIPMDEQREIAEYLNREISKYDVAISNLEKQIDQITELRTRLISDVVTGQIDVRGIKVPDVEYTYTETREEELEETEEN